MAIKIQKKIVGYEVVKEEEEAAAREAARAEVEERQSAKIIRMTERVARPEGPLPARGSHPTHARSRARDRVQLAAGRHPG